MLACLVAGSPTAAVPAGAAAVDIAGWLAAGFAAAFVGLAASRQATASRL